MAMSISRERVSFSPLTCQGSILTILHMGLFGISVHAQNDVNISAFYSLIVKKLSSNTLIKPIQTSVKFEAVSMSII